MKTNLKTNNQIIPLNVEALKLRLQQQRCTKCRFRLPLSLEDTKIALTEAVKAEVSYQHRQFADALAMQTIDDLGVGSKEIIDYDNVQQPAAE